MYYNKVHLIFQVGNPLFFVILVFENFLRSSFKKCARERRSTWEPRNFDTLTPSTKVLSRPERFLACSENKEKLQRLSRTFLIDVSKENDISKWFGSL